MLLKISHNDKLEVVSIDSCFVTRLQAVNGYFKVLLEVYYHDTAPKCLHYHMFIIEMFKYELDIKTDNDLPEVATFMITVQRLAQL